MRPLFRNIRRQLASENKFQKYFRYAIGEIVLVVIGILIALSINNWNENRKERNKELIYLNNIKEDIKLNIASLEVFIVTRDETVNSVAIVLEYFNGKQKIDHNTFNFHNINILEWYPFVQHSNTYEELMNSGKFAIISNKSIKNELQNIQSNFEMILFIENEMQQDYERYLYQPYFNLVDLDTALKNYTDQLNNKETTTIEKLDKDEIELLLKNKLYKNGLVLAAFNSNKLVEEFTNLIEKSKLVIQLIDNESAVK